MFNPKVLNNKPTPPSSAGYTSNTRFMKTFNSMLAKQGGAMRRATPGIDMARGLGQAKAAVKGRNNAKRTPMAANVDALSAAMQHSVRNRSVEQGGNAANMAQSTADGSNAASSIYNYLNLKT
jgi:hypothetical protein